MESLRGQLLIASPRMGDPNFAHCVLLMIQHDEDGAMGIIINRPLEITVAEACRDALEGSCRIDDVLYHGGPCPGPLMAIHGTPRENEKPVAEGLYFTTEKSRIEPMLLEPSSPARFYVGYAGWSGGQLESEIFENSWLTAQARVRHVLEADDPARLWRRLVAQTTLRPWIRPDGLPDDPSLN